MKKLLEYDPITKTRRTFHADADGEQFVVHTKQDVTQIVEANRALYNAVDERAGWKGDWHHVAAVPFVAFHEWLEAKRRGVSPAEAHRLFMTDQKLMAAFLNDRDNLAFRTRPGAV